VALVRSWEQVCPVEVLWQGYAPKQRRAGGPGRADDRLRSPIAPVLETRTCLHYDLSPATKREESRGNLQRGSGEDSRL
jgi:hypothetical protein